MQIRYVDGFFFREVSFFIFFFSGGVLYCIDGVVL